MKRIHFFMCVWLLASIYLLLAYVFSEQAFLDSEIHMLYFLKLSVLSFPLGPFILGVYEVSILSLDIFVEIYKSLSMLYRVIISWAIMTVFGFLQWFVFVPWTYKTLWKRWKRWKKEKRKRGKEEKKGTLPF